MDIKTAQKELAKAMQVYRTFVEAGELLGELASLEDAHIDARKTLQRLQAEAQALEGRIEARRASDEAEAAARRQTLDVELGGRAAGLEAQIERLTVQRDELQAGLATRTAEYEALITEGDAHVTELRKSINHLTETRDALRAQLVRGAQ